MSTSSKLPSFIKRLPDSLVDQIAAGEVVERPVSVVKELIENSLDAYAKNITIEVAKGGTNFIAVSDDGTGLDPRFIKNALSRHWTSKLENFDDLRMLRTFGFRGEALASIASVATLTITSRVRGEQAWMVTSSPNSVLRSPIPAKGNFGTRIEVRELFHNVPVRRRFLKQPRTEYLHIQRLVRQFAFACPLVAFTLKQEGSPRLRLKPSPREDVHSSRWHALFGKKFCDEAVFIDCHEEVFGLSGWVGTPKQATNATETQFFCVNGRIVRDRQLQHAVRVAYQDDIAPGRYPVYALDFSLAPQNVDVNVHPGKREVRVSDLRVAHDFLFSTIRHAIYSGPPSGRPNTADEEETSLKRGAEFFFKGGGSKNGLVSRVDVAHDFGELFHCVGSRWILFSRHSVLSLMDFRGAWRSVLEARFELQKGSDAKKRDLLFPERIEDLKLTKLLLGDSVLEEMGFAIDDLGGLGAVLRALPSILPELNSSSLVNHLSGILGVNDTRGAMIAASVMAIEETGREELPGLLRSLWASSLAAGIDPVTFQKTLRQDGISQLWDKI